MLSRKLYDCLRYIFEQNAKNTKPLLKDLMKNLEITDKTAKKRVNQLLDAGFIEVERQGRTKLLKITSKGEKILKQ